MVNAHVLSDVGDFIGNVLNSHGGESIERESPTSYCLLPTEAMTTEMGLDVAAVMEAGVEEQEEMGMILVMILLSLLGEDLGFWVCF